MDIYLINEEKNNTFHFPVNPENIGVGGEKKLDTVEIINIGEVDFPTGDRIQEVGFSTFFPVNYDTYCQYPDIPAPQDALHILLDWRDAGKPVRLLITESPVNILVLIGGVSWEIKGGEPGDIYFNINFRSWREIKVRTTAQPAPPRTGIPRTRPDTKPVPKIYTVRAGDTLYTIAKRELGAGSRFKDIFSGNADVIGHDPNLIKPGQKLVMPA